MNDPWPLTAHWLRDHRSKHLTADQMALLLNSVNKPHRAQSCSNCGWPGSSASLCEVCCDMLEVVMDRPGLVQAHKEWQLQQRLQNRRAL
jgi:hypothetical protein